MSKIDIKFMIGHTHKEGTTERSHTHPCAELVYYVRGTGKSVIGAHEYDYSDNTAVFISGNEEHSEYHETETDVIFFGCNFNNDVFQLRSGIYEDKDNILCGLFREILQEYYSKRLYYKIATENVAEKILLTLARKANATYDKKRIENYIDMAVNYININLQSNITPALIANKLGYSHDYFRHQFLKYVGVAPKEYILRARINEAKEYLANSNQTIEEIAERFLFANSSHFSTVFRRYIGMMPNQYRKTYIKENHIEVEYIDENETDKEETKK